MWSSAKPVPVEHYSRLPAIYDASISPDGNWLAAVMDTEGTYILRVFNLNDASDPTVRGSAYSEDVKVNWVKWANNETIVIVDQPNRKTRWGRF